MEDKPGRYFFQNGVRKSFHSNKPETKESKHRLYEVLRVIRGIPLFMEDHLDRLISSVRALDYETGTLKRELENNLQGVIRENHIQEGNLMLICGLKNQGMDTLAYSIPHKYPNPDDYLKGVNLATCSLHRPDPNLKQMSVSDRIRDTINRDFGNENLHEVLLVNQQGRITEGSRSNFFLVKDGCLYTASDEEVLKGITRKYVLKVACSAGISCHFSPIPVEILTEYDAAFICGTSSKILPVKKINDIEFDSRNATIRELMELYDKEIENYINSRSTQ